MRCKQKKMSSKGFTMVELLAAITILGIVTLVAIKGVSGLIERAKNERFIQQEKTLSLAAESYIQANSRLKPKTIGESRLIEVKDLRKANYLKEDIVNEKGESCMENSVVRVYKLSKTEYTYYPALYCGEETRPAEIAPPEPNVSAYFTDATLKNKNNNGVLTLSDVSKARLMIDMNGGTTSGGDSIAVDGYSYSIDAVDDTGRRTVFDSGSLSANRKTSLSISFDLNDYIDLSSRTDFYVKVSVTNVYGGVKTYDYGIDTPNAGGSYKDNDNPKCVNIQNQANEGEWINKYSPVKERTITVGCDDGDGSGCVRDTFSRTWPNKEQPSTEYGFIAVRDNAGNRNPELANYLTGSCAPWNRECCVRVNVDIVSPVVKVSPYHGTGINSSFTNGSTKLQVKDGNSYVYQVSADSSNDYSRVIQASDFKMANERGWVGSDVPTGIAFKVEISDDFKLDRWEWTTNKPGLTSSNDPNFNNLEKNGEYRSDEYNGSRTSANITVGFFGKDKNGKCIGCGARKGVLTVWDVAGNDTQFIIYLNYSVDTPCPSNPEDPWGQCPTKLKASLDFYKYREPDVALPGDSYNFKSAQTNKDKWSTTSIIAKPPLSVVDEVKKINGLYFEYVVNLDNKTTSENGKKNPFISNPDYNGTGYNFDNSGGTNTTNGKNTITLRICDQAHNCVSSEEYNVWIDTIAPICTVKSYSYSTNKFSQSNASTYDDGHWLKDPIKARITASCKDESDLFTTSSCATGSFFYDYNSDIAITNGGAKGTGDGGYVEDVAGNRTDCRSDVTVKIDHQPPTCKVVATRGGSTYDGRWLNKADIDSGGGVDVTTTASDPKENGVSSGLKGIYEVTGSTQSALTNPVTKNYINNINTTNASSAGNNVTVIAKDVAGNQADCKPKIVVKIDKNPPTCSPTGTSSTWRNPSSVTITLNCSDTGGSGCDNDRHGLTKKYTTNTNQASTTIYDIAGNSATCGKYNVKLDKVAPNCGTTTGEQTYYSAGPRPITVQCNDNTSNNNVNSGCPNPNPVERVFTAEGKTGTITIKDNAGNSKNCTVNTYIKDEPPKECPKYNGSIAKDSDLFGDKIDQNTTFSTARSIRYKHLNLGNGGSGTDRYTINISSTTILYNYLPLSPDTGAGTYTSESYNSSNNRPYAFGFTATWSSEDWCFADGTQCLGTHYCYARVCKNPDACGQFLGWTAEAMNDYIDDRNCHYARCWCSCTDGGTYVPGTDWYNK